MELNELYLLQNVLEGRCVEAEIWLSEMSVVSTVTVLPCDESHVTKSFVIVKWLQPSLI